MPITGPSGLRLIDQDEFAQLDYRVMRMAFECQNQFIFLADSPAKQVRSTRFFFIVVDVLREKCEP